MRIQDSGDCLQIANCYGQYKHNCPVKLRIEYKHDDSVYKLYRSGTHNHDLNHVERRTPRDNFEDINIQIISSQIAYNVKEEKIE